MNKEQEIGKVRDKVVALASSPLFSYRNEHQYLPVIGEGTYDADIVLVGEAPGEKEAQSGRPFCGRSGKMLDELLASVALDRRKIYISNLVNDRPPENRDPTPTEIALYAPFLEEQLSIIKPKVVVMLGRHSMNHLFVKAGIGDKLQPISKMHGEVFEGDLGYGRVHLLPLYHPAVGLYNPNMKAVLFEDFKKLLPFIKK